MFYGIQFSALIIRKDKYHFSFIAVLILIKFFLSKTVSNLAEHLQIILGLLLS